MQCYRLSTQNFAKLINNSDIDLPNTAAVQQDCTAVLVLDTVQCHMCHETGMPIDSAELASVQTSQFVAFHLYGHLGGRLALGFAAIIQVGSGTKGYCALEALIASLKQECIVSQRPCWS
jgi:hypothetical protein